LIDLDLDAMLLLDGVGRLFGMLVLVHHRLLGCVVFFKQRRPPHRSLPLSAEPLPGRRVQATEQEAAVAARAIWKGHLGVGELSCAVALYAAATTSERISFHIVNSKTGNRVRRDYVDEQTGKPVDRDDQVKGYET